MRCRICFQEGTGNTIEREDTSVREGCEADHYEGSKEVLAPLDLAGCQHAQEHDDHVTDHAIAHVAFQRLHCQGVWCAQCIQLVNDDLHGIFKHQFLVPVIHHFLLPLPNAGHYPTSQEMS